MAALWLGALNPLVLFHLIAGGHNEALMLGAMLAGLVVAWHRERWSAACVLIARCGMARSRPPPGGPAFLVIMLALRAGGRWRDLLRYRTAGGRGRRRHLRRR